MAVKAIPTAAATASARDPKVDRKLIVEQHNAAALRQDMLEMLGSVFWAVRHLAGEAGRQPAGATQLATLARTGQFLAEDWAGSAAGECEDIDRQLQQLAALTGERRP